MSTLSRDDARLRRSDAAVGFAAGIVALVNYVSTLCPTVGPGDSGELALAALQLGVCHPPGYPLLTWLGRIATVLGGEPAAATNALNAVLAAAAVGTLYLAARTLGFWRTGSLLAALALGFSATFWQQTTSYEVYTAAILMLSLLLLVAGRARAGRPELLPAGGYLLGLAAAHQPTALLWAPALLAFALTGTQRANLRRLVVPTLLAAVLGATAALGTYFLARSGPTQNWGDPSTLARFLAHITGRQYSDLAFAGAPAGGAGGFLRLLVSEFGIPVLALMLVGLLGIILCRPALLPGVLLLAATAAFAITYSISDFRVHLLPGFVGLALLAGGAADLIEKRLDRIGGYIALLLLAAPGYALFANYTAAAEARIPLVRNLGANLLSSLPDSAVLVSGDDASGNAARYLQRTEGARPDVEVVSLEMLFSPVYHAQLRRRLPLGDYEASLRRAGFGPRDERKQVLLGDVVAAVRTGRPVFVTTDVVSQSFFEGPVARRWRPVPQGIVVWLADSGAVFTADSLVGSNDRLWQSYRVAGLERPLRSPDLANVQFFYAAARNNFGAFCRAQGWTGPALASFARAREMPAPAWFRAVVERQIAALVPASR